MLHNCDSAAQIPTACAPLGQLLYSAGSSPPAAGSSPLAAGSSPAALEEEDPADQTREADGRMREAVVHWEAGDKLRFGAHQAKRTRRENELIPLSGHSTKRRQPGDDPEQQAWGAAGRSVDAVGGSQAI